MATGARSRDASSARASSGRRRTNPELHPLEHDGCREPSADRAVGCAIARADATPRQTPVRVADEARSTLGDSHRGVAGREGRQRPHDETVGRRVGDEKAGLARRARIRGQLASRRTKTHVEDRFLAQTRTPRAGARRVGAKRPTQSIGIAWSLSNTGEARSTLVQVRAWRECPARTCDFAIESFRGQGARAPDPASTLCDWIAR